MSEELRWVQVCDDCGTHHRVSEWPQIGGDLCDDCADERLARLCIDCGNSDEPRDSNKRCPLCADLAAWEDES